MKKLFTAALFVFPLMYFTHAAAQSNTIVINGKVTSFDESLPLEGATVQVKNSKNATGSQADGSFTLSISPEEKILVISLAGYEKKEIPITNAKEYNIILTRTGNLFIESRQQSHSGFKQNEMLK